MREGFDLKTWLWILVGVMIYFVIADMTVNQIGKSIAGRGWAVVRAALGGEVNPNNSRTPIRPLPARGSEDSEFIPFEELEEVEVNE